MAKKQTAAKVKKIMAMQKKKKVAKDAGKMFGSNY